MPARPDLKGHEALPLRSQNQPGSAVEGVLRIECEFSTVC